MSSLHTLLEDIQLELGKSGNEDATNLIDRIDIILSKEKKKAKPCLAGESNPMVTDYVPEFRARLIEQLRSDYARWGNTWLKRSKEGQELRTKARYTDYFDMFEETGVPVPWLKIVGNALICWIRDNHPELCFDIPLPSSIAEECDLPNKIKTITEIISTPLGELTVEEGERLQKWACEAIHGDSDIMEKLIEEKKNPKEE